MMESVLFEEDIGAIAVMDETSSVNKIHSSNDKVEGDLELTSEEMCLKLSELESKVISLEAEKTRLLGLLSEDKETVSVGTGTEHKDNGARFAPGSIMSLSTGSEESVIEDEKFVKIKPCEIESSSSKASSQCDKENLELEEQIQHLNDQLESLRGELKAKDVTCETIKLELESSLLEKNVESESISKVLLELKSLKQSLMRKNEEVDEIVIILDEVVHWVKPHIHDSTHSTGVQDQLDVKLNVCKQLPSIFRTFEQEIEKKDRALQEVNDELKELQDQQSDVIGGYQLVTENYEKLQLEFDQFKQERGEIKAVPDQVYEELERFKEELISKDEDLMEIQTKCEELQENLSTGEIELESLRIKVMEYEKLKNDVIEIENVDQSVETERESSDTKNSTPSEVQDYFQKNLVLQSTSVQLQGYPVKPLRDRCLEQLPNLMNALQHKEFSMLNTLEELKARNLELEAQVSSQECEIKRKGTEMEQLLSSIQEYQESIGRKAEEINETIAFKNCEIEQLMLTYTSYYEAKEKAVAELNSVIEDKVTRIQCLENERFILIKNYSEDNNRHKEEIKKLENILHQVNSTHETELSTHHVKFETNLRNLESYNHELEREIETKIQTLHTKNSEANLVLQRYMDLTSRTEILEQDLSRLRKENIRLTKLLETSKESVRIEYENKFKEDAILHESDTLSFHHKIKSFNEELKKNTSELGKTMELLTKVKTENQILQTEIAATNVEKERVQVELNFELDEIKKKDVLILKLRTDLTDMETQILNLQSEFEVREAHLVTQVEQPVVQILSSPDLNVDKLLQLQEEIRVLNHTNIISSRKIELLQSKILEIETSEIKAFEESFKLKNWIRDLELDNVRYQEELNILNNSSDSGDNPKIKTLQDEILRLVLTLDERDKRCIQLTLEITRLLEERDGLQLKLSNVLKHNVELTTTRNTDGKSSTDAPIYNKKDLEEKLAQLEDTNFRMHIDLKREREARKLVQEQLLFSQTSRIYRDRHDFGPSRLPHSDSGYGSPESLEHGSNLVGKDSEQVVHI